MGAFPIIFLCINISLVSTYNNIIIIIQYNDKIILILLLYNSRPVRQVTPPHGQVCLCQAARSSHTHTHTHTQHASTHAGADTHRKHAHTDADVARQRQNRDNIPAVRTLSQKRSYFYRLHLFGKLNLFSNITHLLEHPAMSCDIDIPPSHLSTVSTTRCRQTLAGKTFCL